MKLNIWLALLVSLGGGFWAAFGFYAYQYHTHHCPLPSIEQVQSDLNDIIDPLLFDKLEVDGVAGLGISDSKTVKAWSFYSTSWEAENERNLIGD